MHSKHSCKDGFLSQDLTPESPRELTRAQQETRIAQLKAETTIPILEAARDVILQWSKDGTLHQELHNKKLGSVINDISKLLTALQPRGLVIVPPSVAPGDAKDASWFKANSATNLTEAQRKNRRKAIEAEVVEE